MISQAVQGIDQPWPYITWYFYDYTGAGAYNTYSTSGTLGVIENTPGSYTCKGVAKWMYGVSEEITINLTVTQFTLTRDTMFGGLDGLQLSADLGSGTQQTYLSIAGAVVNDGGTFTWDVGSIRADSANCLGFWDYINSSLLAFRYDISGVLEHPYKWSGVLTLPVQGSVLGSGGTQWTSTSSQQTAANISSVLDLRVPLGGYYQGSLGSTHFLEITPLASEFDNFGAKNSDWSYGFQLYDDWLATGSGSQLMAPDGSSFFVNAITGYGIGASPFENVYYGNTVSGPFSSSTNGASWNVSSTNWLIGSAGDLVVVTYDGAATQTWTIYVEGVARWISTSVDTYMDATTTQQK